MDTKRIECESGAVEYIEYGVLPAGIGTRILIYDEGGNSIYFVSYLEKNDLWHEAFQYVPGRGTFIIREGRAVAEFTTGSQKLYVWAYDSTFIAPTGVSAILTPEQAHECAALFAS